MQNCYKEQAVEQKQRLTTKHIHTLKFLQEIVAENKELKEKIETLQGKDCRCHDLDQTNEENQKKIQEIQQDYLQRADEINALLEEKHQAEMMKKVEQQLEMERSWLDEKQQLLTEIERLKKQVEDLQRKLSEDTEHSEQIKIFELKVASLEQEIARLMGCLSEETERVSVQTQELERLRRVEGECARLRDELTAAEQLAQELQYKVRRLEAEVGDQRAGERTDLVDALKARVMKLHREKAQLEENDKEYLRQISCLTEENHRLLRALDDSERMRQDMRGQLDELTNELVLLKKQLSKDKDQQTFRDFVSVKRELIAVKEENDALRIKLKFGSNQGVTLPSLKPDAKSGQSARPESGRKSDQKRRESLPRKESLQYGVVPYK